MRNNDEIKRVISSMNDEQRRVLFLLVGLAINGKLKAPKKEK